MAALVTDAEVNAYLGTTDQTYEKEIASASKRIEGMIGPVIHTAFTEYHDGEGDDLIFTKYRPIKDASVMVTDTLDSSTVPTDEYTVYPGEGMIRRIAGVWAKGFRRWKVDYTAGYCVDVTTVPDDIKEATLMLIKASKSGGSTAVISRKKVGVTDVQYDTEKSGNVQDEVSLLLAPYMKVVL
jgi:hypothetical protein